MDGMKRKLEAALSAIEDLFADTSVSPASTLEALEELQSNIESKIDCLKSENNL